MAEKVIMPQLGESVTEGTVSKWLVKAGEAVKKYEPLCEVQTDKVVAEVPSTFDGTVTEIVVREGETVSVGTTICYMVLEGVAAAPQEPSGKPEPAKPLQVENSAKQRYSPAVLKLAQDHQLDLSLITGTGAGGRITRMDILDIVEGRRQISEPTGNAEESQTPATPSATKREQLPKLQKPVPPQLSTATKTAEASKLPTDEGDRMIPVTAVRRTIAHRMVQSVQEAPHAWMMTEVDVTNLVRYRERMKEEFKRKEGFTLTYMPFFIKAVVEAIKQYPMLNSQWAGDNIIIKKAINMSIAVGTDDALYVPVIKDADQRNVYGLAKALDELAKKSREGKLASEDMSGGTFTITNTGSFGSMLSAPIINPPQTAILSVEAIQKKPVVTDPQTVSIRDTLNICLSLDHRVLDGLVCGRFLQSVKQNLEQFNPDTNLY